MYTKARNVSLENDIGFQVREPRRNPGGLDVYQSQVWFDF